MVLTDITFAQHPPPLQNSSYAENLYDSLHRKRIIYYGDATKARRTKLVSA